MVHLRKAVLDRKLNYLPSYVNKRLGYKKLHMT